MFFFFNDTATTEIYTLSLHDALPISGASPVDTEHIAAACPHPGNPNGGATVEIRSEEHTSELQSQSNLVCRLLLEKKKFAALRVHRPRADACSSKSVYSISPQSARPP